MQTEEEVHDPRLIDMRWAASFGDGAKTTTSSLASLPSIKHAYGFSIGGNVPLAPRSCQFRERTLRNQIGDDRNLDRRPCATLAAASGADRAVIHAEPAIGASRGGFVGVQAHREDLNVHHGRLFDIPSAAVFRVVHESKITADSQYGQ